MRKYFLLIAVTFLSIALTAQTSIQIFQVKKNDDDAFGLKNQDGKIIVPASYIRIIAVEGYFLGITNENVTYFNNEGKKVATYCDIKPFENNISIVAVCKGTIGFEGLMKRDGKLLVSPNKYNQIARFRSYRYYKVSLSTQDKIKYGLIDSTGKSITPVKYDWIDERVGNDMIIFEINKKKGFMNKHGKEIIPAKYDTAAPFKDGQAIVFTKLPTLRQFLIDTAGNVIREIQ